MDNKKQKKMNFSKRSEFHVIKTENLIAAKKQLLDVIGRIKILTEDGYTAKHAVALLEKFEAFCKLHVSYISEFISFAGDNKQLTIPHNQILEMTKRNEEYRQWIQDLEMIGISLELH